MFEGGAVEAMAFYVALFSRRFAWVDDRYGLSWRLNLPSPRWFALAINARFQQVGA